jgi:ATP-dependent Clp protease, protease subunit
MPANDQEIIDSQSSQQLQDAGLYVFMDEVTTASVKPVIEWLLLENLLARPKKKELLLMICSDGGDLAAAFALVDVMRASKIPVKTVGLGSVASSALVVFLTGTPGRRILTPNTSILSHQYSWGTEGKHHELFSVTKEFNLMQQRMLAHYVATTGLSEDDVKAKLLPASDVYLGADEALSLGICDRVEDFKR